MCPGTLGCDRRYKREGSMVCLRTPPVPTTPGGKEKIQKRQLAKEIRVD